MNLVFKTVLIVLNVLLLNFIFTFMVHELIHLSQSRDMSAICFLGYYSLGNDTYSPAWVTAYEKTNGIFDDSDSWMRPLSVAQFLITLIISTKLIKRYVIKAELAAK